MVQVNLRKEFYDEAIKQGIGANPGINEWINGLAEQTLFPERRDKK